MLIKYYCTLTLNHRSDLCFTVYHLHDADSSTVSAFSSMISFANENDLNRPRARSIIGDDGLNLFMNFISQSIIIDREP